MTSASVGGNTGASLPPSEQLKPRAREVGVELSDPQIEAFDLYARELKESARKHNLTAVPPNRYVEDHFVDSLTLLQTGKIATGAKLCDIGAGAGFPGLPVKLAFPKVELLLIESNGKKAEFLRRVIGALGIEGASVFQGRAEAAGRDYDIRGSFDAVVCRAVASLPVLLEYALPLLRVGGWFLAMKGPSVSLETAAAAKASEELGGRVEEIFSPRGQGGDRRGVIVIVQKMALTPDKFPRNIGIPAKRPLGG